MADNSGGSSVKKYSGIIGGIVLVINSVLCFFEKGIPISQMIAFINSWPVVLLGMSICITCIVIECYRQENKTKRKDNNMKKIQNDFAEEKTKRNELERQLNEEKNKNLEMSIEIEKLKAENKNLEMSIEIAKLKQESKRPERDNELWVDYSNDCLEKANKCSEQNANRIGGQGAANIVRFDGRNGLNT